MGRLWKAFGEQLDPQLDRLQSELKEETYQPQPVRQVPIPKAGKPGEFRTLGVPTIYDRVCQQAVLNRLEPIFEPVFDEANFGYRRGRSTKDAMRKVWREIQSGREWIVDADLKDFFGSVDHAKLLTLVAQRIADGRVLRLIEAMLKAGSYGKGRLFPSERGTPQGSVVSPLLSNILLTPFDQEMRSKGFQLTRYADDWVMTCRVGGRGAGGGGRGASDPERVGCGTPSAEDADRPCPARVRVSWLQDQAWQAASGCCRGKIRSGAKSGALYAYPREKSIRRFMDQVRALTRRRVPLRTTELIERSESCRAGLGQHYKRAHVRKLFNRLERWIVRRIWSHRFKRWRNGGWRELPNRSCTASTGL